MTGIADRTVRGGQERSRIKTLTQAALNADETVEQVEDVLDGLSSTLKELSSSLAALNATVERMETGQQLHPLVLGQRPVARVHARPGQQLGHHFLVHVGVLPHVQATQVKPEEPHAFSQQGQAVVGQQCAAVRAQRRVDGVEVGPQFGRRGVRRQTQVQLVLRSAVQDLGGGGGEPAADHPQRPPVWLVGAGLLGAVLGQRGQLGGTATRRADIDSSCSQAVSSAR